MKTDVHFTFERDTKRTYRFAECARDGGSIDPDSAKIGVLYVKKSALGNVQPKGLVVTLETKD